MSKKIVVIQLGYDGAVALLSTDQYNQKLTIFQEATIEEHVYAPAAAISIYGKPALLAIQAALNAEFPLLPSNG